MTLVELFVVGYAIGFVCFGAVFAAAEGALVDPEYSVALVMAAGWPAMMAVLAYMVFTEQ